MQQRIYIGENEALQQAIYNEYGYVLDIMVQELELDWSSLHSLVLRKNEILFIFDVSEDVYVPEEEEDNYSIYQVINHRDSLAEDDGEEENNNSYSDMYLAVEVINKEGRCNGWDDGDGYEEGEVQYDLCDVKDGDEFIEGVEEILKGSCPTKVWSKLEGVKF